MTQATTSRTHDVVRASPWRDLVCWYRTALERRRQRLALADLDDHLLKDIGLSREDALRESTASFWR